ncbi:MAG: hypothetical protein NT027_09640 [Proteobacteria bacterium]|nr:hypothetical protein [Pseudomonadota bacterium]
MISRRLANLFSVTVALLALSHCSVLKPSKHVSVEQKLKAGVSNQIDTVQKHGYVISFQTQQELARHQSDVRSLGGSTSTIGNSLSLRVNIDLNKLSALQVPLTADLASNAEIRVSLSRPADHLNNLAFSSSSDQSLQDLLSVRKITGVDSLRKRFPSADGSGVKVAVFDTGIDFGVKGLSETRMNKLEGFYDLTNFGKVTLTKATKSEKGSFVFADSYEIAVPNAVNLPQELQAGILDEKIIARQYLAPSVDIDGNGKDNDQFHFLKIDQKIFIDLNQDRNVSDEESEILTPPKIS